MIFTSYDHLQVKDIGDKIRMEANFGKRLPKIAKQTFGNQKKINSVFDVLTYKTVEFSKFFLPEVLLLFEEILNTPNKFQLNIRVANKVLKYFEKNGEYSEFSIDYDRIKNEFDFRILDHQKPIFTTYEKYKREFGYRGILLDAEPGTGKAQPLNCKVLTTRGFKTIGSLKVGDKVVTPKGFYTYVTGIYPQGLKDTYKIILEDGRNTKACLEHLWKVKHNDEIKIIDTMTIKELMEKGEDVYLPLVEGLWNNVNCIYTEEDMYGFGREISKTNSLSGTRYKLIDLPSPEYFSLEAKLALISGMRGTETGIREDFTISIINDSKLRKYFSKLLYSMGAYVETEIIHDTVFLTARYDRDWIKIKSISYNATSECVCISVKDKEHLYVTDNFIVTHNTFSSLALSEGSKCDVTFIICPLQTVNKVWVSSIAGGPGDCVFKKPQDYYVISEGKEYKGERFVIVHYEGLDKAIDMFKNKSFANPAVIIDESHNLADYKSNRTKRAIEFVDILNTNNVFCLSGTPLKSSYRELVVLFKFICKNFDSELENKFLTFYNNPNELFKQFLQERYQGISVKVKKEAIGLKDIKTATLLVKLKNGDKFTLNSIRDDIVKFVNKRIKELDEQKPYWEETYERLLQKGVEYSNGAIREKELSTYRKYFEIVRNGKSEEIETFPQIVEAVNVFEKKVISFLQGDDKKLFREAKTIVKYPMLKIQGEALGIIVTGARIKCHEELAKAINYEAILNSSLKKTVIFSSYVNVCNQAYEKCREEGFRPIDVFGESSKNLTNNVDKFFKDSDINPLVATYKSLGVGVPLIIANTVICIDLPFRLYMYDQALSRVWRLGQDEPVTVYLVKLDTGKEKNINGRTAEIMEFFKKEIEDITGYNSNIKLDFGENQAEFEDGEPEDINIVSEFAITNESYDSIRCLLSEKYINKYTNTSKLLDRNTKFLAMEDWCSGKDLNGREFTVNN